MTVRLFLGDARDVLPTLPAGSIRCCVTSPPYWGLRDYKLAPTVWGGDAACAHAWGGEEIARGPAQTQGLTSARAGRSNVDEQVQRGVSTGAFCPCGAWRGTLGNEPTPEIYTAHLVEVFRHVRRVLADSGTLWLNLGDSFNASGRESHGTRIGYKQGTNRASASGTDNVRATAPGLKPKDLVGIPWRAAFALQADGWTLRSEIIWHKPNVMPESVKDRPTKAHETVFLLTKGPRYYWDAEAVKEETARDRQLSTWGDRKKREPVRRGDPSESGHVTHTDSLASQEGRNLRSVWSIPTKSYSGTHFATFPPDLVRPMILAGTSEKGQCRACGAPWKRVVEKTNDVREDFNGSAFDRDKTGARDGGDRTQPGDRFANRTVGWRPTCACVAAGRPVPDVVLDPFGGSGTTALVAQELGRDAVLIEASADYCALEMRRLGIRRVTTVAPERR